MKNKKTIIPFAAFLAFSMTACSTASSQAGSSSAVQMENPLSEFASLEELSEAADCALIRPEGVEIADEVYSMIDGEIQIAEYSFTANGTECFLRFSKAGADTDICGIYGTDGTLFEQETEEYYMYAENNDVKAERWFTVDGQYVFAAMDAETWDYEVFSEICSQFEDMAPKNWTADAPYSDYLAAAGGYQDETGDIFAYLVVEDDHMAVEVLIRREDENTLYWDMDAVLNGNKLDYEEETLYEIVYDENTGVQTTELLETGGAGSVTLDGDTLTFENAYSEQLKTLVLKRAE